MTSVGIVSQHGHPFLIVGVDEIEITVSVEVAEGRAEAHPIFIETPWGADVFKLQTAEIAEGEVMLNEHRGTALHLCPFRR